MRKTYRLLELFSGIGSQHKALIKNAINVELVGTCEWDFHAFLAYCLINGISIKDKNLDPNNRHHIINELLKFNLSSDGKSRINLKSLLRLNDKTLYYILSAINNSHNFTDVTKLKGKNIPKSIDILTYSFPCQDLSNMGQIHGYNKGIDKNSGSRSSLLWEVGRILREIDKSNKKLPRFLVMENVKTLLSDRHIGNFKAWQNDLKKLGYYNKCYLLDANNFGIPQERTRLIMISVLLPSNRIDKASSLLDQFFNKNPLDKLSYKDLGIEHKTLKSILKLNYKVKKYYKEALASQPNNTISRRKIWDNNPKIVEKGNKINLDNVKTLTTKQDRHPNSGNIYFDYKNNRKSKFRFLTPRECLMLMGFDEKDYENIVGYDNMLVDIDKVFTRDKLVRMAGNSIPVNLLQAVFKQIESIDKFLYKNLGYNYK